MNKKDMILKSTAAAAAVAYSMEEINKISELPVKPKGRRKTLNDIEAENRIKYARGVSWLQEKLADVRQDAFVSVIAKKGVLDGTELDDFKQIAAKYGYLAAMHTDDDEDSALAPWIAKKLVDEAKAFLARCARNIKKGAKPSLLDADKERYRQKLEKEILDYEQMRESLGLIQKEELFLLSA